MKRVAMRWLVVALAWFAPGLPVARAQQAPGGCDGVDAEGTREMRKLFQAERDFLMERDRYSRDLAAVGFAPEACADGSRAPVPGPEWVAGCHFAYQVTSVTGMPASSFSAIARGAAGTQAEDVTVRVGSDAVSGISFWLERPQSRRAVNWYECLPTGPFSMLESEGVEAMHHLYESMRSFLMEKDRYSQDFRAMGFLPMGCTDGSRAAAPGPEWVTSCHFAYRVTSVTGMPEPSYVAIAQGVPGTPLENVSLRISSSPAQPYSFWLERSGARQYIAWDESLPTEAGPAAQSEEGQAHVRGLSSWMRAFFQEKDRYPEHIREIDGFQPMSCGDGSRAQGPDETWMGGCRFLYRIDTVNPKRFVVTARGVSGFVRGITIRIDQTGTLTMTSDYASSRHAPSP